MRTSAPDWPRKAETRSTASGRVRAMPFRVSETLTPPLRSDELRIAKTESQFRQVNERIADTAEQFGAETAELVCECSDPACGRRIEAPLSDYERVARTRPGYRIVRKLSNIGAVARRLDPRSR